MVSQVRDLPYSELLNRAILGLFQVEFDYNPNLKSGILLGGALALHVDKLQRNVVILLLKQPHDFLEVIDLLTSEPDLVVLNS